MVRERTSHNGIIFKDNKKLVEFLRDNDAHYSDANSYIKMADVEIITDDAAFMDSEICEKILDAYYYGPVYLVIRQMFEDDNPMIDQMIEQGLAVEIISNLRRDNEWHECDCCNPNLNY